jgi:hypothetical protein
MTPTSRTRSRRRTSTSKPVWPPPNGRCWKEPSPWLRAITIWQPRCCDNRNYVYTLLKELDLMHLRRPRAAGAF